MTLHKNTLLGCDMMLSLDFKHHALCLLHGQNLSASVDKIRTLMSRESTQTPRNRHLVIKYFILSTGPVTHYLH